MYDFLDVEMTFNEIKNREDGDFSVFFYINN